MPREKNKKTHNIFLVDIAKTKRLLPHLINSTYGEIAASIMDSDHQYVEQQLKSGIDTKGFMVKLYFRVEENLHSKFSQFCTTFIEENQPAVTFFPRSSSSVMFLWNESKMFAITTGQGFRMIENYEYSNFGLIIASAFERRFRITSLDSNAMSSIVHSTRTVYSNEVDFIDVETLDTIFKEVTGRLKDKSSVHSLLDLAPDAKKSSMKITAKNYIQFSSSLNFEGLLHLLNVISEYDFDNLNDNFNLITPITAKKNRDTITENNNQVIHSMYDALASGLPIPFDLFHKDTIAFISAESYVIYDKENQNDYATHDDYEASALISAAFREYLSGNEPTEASFYAFISSVRLRSEKEGNIETDGTLLQHVSGEICVNGINYYVFYGEYYRLNAAYNERLKVSLSGKLRPEFYTREICTVWERGENEDIFNLNASQDEDYVHLHKIKPDYIEFCDLLKNCDDEIIIVHVKDGFDGEMRVLDRQVELSIAKIMDLKHNNSTTYMRNLYHNAAVNNVGKNITSVFPTVEDFIDSMKSKQIRYIIAIRPTNPNLIESQSNIAKHCLNALILRCFNQGIALNIQVL